MNKKILYAIIALLFVVSVKAQDYSGYTNCAEQDSLALVAFYNATDGPNWLSNQDGFSKEDLSDDIDVYYNETYPNAGMGKWLEGPVKDWFGVLLEKQQVGNSSDSVWRVIHLRPTIARRSVGDNKLSGYIPREVGLLTALKWFKVNGNVGLKGSELPDEIYQPTLEAFDIEAASFKGIISSGFRKCTSLSYLNVRYNQLDSIPPLDFLSADQLLKFNETMWFYDNQFSYATLEPTVTYFLSVGDIEYEMRNQVDVGREKEIIVKPGETVTLTSNEAGKNGEYSYWKFNGSINYKIKKGQSCTISNIAASDTGAYSVIVANDYIRLNDANSTYNTTATKPIHVRFAPSTPALNQAATSYRGNEITLKFSKPMAVPSSSQKDEFTVTSGGKTIGIQSISRTGRLNDSYILRLESPVLIDEDVTVSYGQGSVTCANNGVLLSFSNHTVTNYTRVAPLEVKAKTRTDGSGIFITFDKYIDPATFVIGNFKVNSATETSVASVILAEGEIDDNISKTIELILSEPLASTDDITVVYTHGSLTGLYSGAVQSFGPVAVENVTEENRQTVTFMIEDGTKSIGNIVLYGVKSTPLSLYDDGTNGDEIAGDNTWSKTMQLTSGSYTWTVYARTTITAYDTIRTIGEDGTITLTLSPYEKNSDTLISSDEQLILDVTDNGFAGKTFYGYKNNRVVFILNAGNYAASYPDNAVVPYLMGIDDDWTTGIQMNEYQSTTSDYLYEASVEELKVGDVLYYNFKINDKWENSSPQQRTHTVAGNDTIYAYFGVITGIDKAVTDDSQFKIYPNPATTKLYVATPDNKNIKSIKVTNLSGHCVLLIENPSSPIDINQLNKGYYILTIFDENDNLYNKRFLKFFN